MYILIVARALISDADVRFCSNKFLNFSENNIDLSFHCFLLAIFLCFCLSYGKKD